jgi:hypothetical protein
MDGMIPEGLLSPQQMEQLQQQRTSDFLLALGAGLAQSSQGMGRRPSTLAGITAALPGAVQAQRASFDQTLQQMLRAQQVQEAQRKRQEEALRQQQLETFIGGLPPEQQARFRAFPTQAAEAMFREQPEQFVQMTPEQVAARGLPANKTFQMSSKTGRISEVGGGGTTVNVGGPGNEFMKKVAEAEAKDFVTIKQSGQQAQRASRDINRLDTLLSKVETGGAAAFKQAAGNIGINTEGLSDIQAAQAIINKLVPAQRPPGSGTMSDADLALYKESLPRIINQPGANKEIIRSMKEINDYLIKEGQIAAEVTAGRISPEEGTRRIFALGNPVQDFFDRTQQSAPRGPVRTTPQDQSLILKYLQPGQ